MPHLPLSKVAAAKWDQAVMVSSSGESEPGRVPGPGGSGRGWPVWAEGGVPEGTQVPLPLQTGTAEAWVWAWGEIWGLERLQS